MIDTIKIILRVVVLLYVSIVISQDTINSQTNLLLQKSHQQQKEQKNEHLLDDLKLIRANFKRINSIKKWTKIDVKELNETTEGGEIKFYYLNGVLHKVMIYQFGETFQTLVEYYLDKEMLSFVFEKSYTYNRPIYYDTKMKEENNDTEEFDFEKSEISEERSYFMNHKLIHQLKNKDNSANYNRDYLLEQGKRIISNFEYLKKIK